MPTTLADLYRQLHPDRWREDPSNAFTDEVAQAHKVLLHPFAGDTRRRVALESWLQAHQPCLFGRIAAGKEGIHYCFLTVNDLLVSDDHIRSKIADAKRLWKRRALRGERKHGFLLAFCDEAVALANPDEALRRFALHLQGLAGWVGRPAENDNEVVDEWLYLAHPTEKRTVKFVFSVDFFAAAGDRRWWHDHRIPGGIAFTANSLGHMVRQQEWYEGRSPRTEWALRTAMLTIDTAATADTSGKPIPHTPATYLVRPPLGIPVRQYEWTGATKPSDAARLQEADCGTYGGYLHTDHAVRPEFFRSDEVPLHKERPYLMDFKYIFDPSSPDYAPFMIGHAATEEEIRAELGDPEDMRFIGAGQASEGEGPLPPAQVTARIDEALDRCRAWRLTEEELDSLL
jgi:hypothetical protein